MCVLRHSEAEEREEEREKKINKEFNYNLVWCIVLDIAADRRWAECGRGHRKKSELSEWVGF